MRYETVIHEGIDWQCVAVDGCRPKGKILQEVLHNKRKELRQSDFKADEIYCNYALEVKKAFHQKAKSEGRAKDDKCLTHFIVPGKKFGRDFEDIHEEMKIDKSNYPSTYRIVIFQFPKNSCMVYKNCIENLLQKIGFSAKEIYREPIGCEIDLQYLTKVEVKGSSDIINNQMPEPEHDENYNAYYKDAWPSYRDFSYPSFEKWYLNLKKKT